MDLLTGTKLNFSKLARGHYEVECFRFVKNKFYKPDSADPGVKRSLLVELKDQVLFLPKYFAERLRDSDEKLMELNSGEKKFLFYDGKRDDK